GAVGEIYIGGAGVARGYFKRADLTAERFLPDPFSAEPGARLYRSGDLARWRADGQLVYLGRNDEQVKIRGFRIELGEIAAQLSQHPAVSDAVVVAQGEANALQLVAYLIAQPGQRIEPMKLREYLATRLPDYMLPIAYVPISAWPLTPNGKLDKRALPEPNAQAFARAEYAAPEGEIEQQLAAIWGELLAVERISRHDNFFALGGHSLLVVRLCSRVQQHFGVLLTVAQVFRHSRLLELASVIATLPQDQLPQMTRLPREQPLPLSFAQQRLWFLWQMEGPSATYNLPALFHLRGELNRAALFASLNTLYARYESWRSTFVLNQQGEAELVLLATEPALPVIEQDLSDLPDAEQRLVALTAQQAHQPFDLSRGPLVRVQLLKLAQQQWYLLLTQHHIISDGWSISVICQELTQLYNGYCQGDTVALPTRTIDYPDYAAWQRQWLSGERLKQQSDYWYQQLHGAPERLTLPTDHPRPLQQSYQGNWLWLSFDAAQSEQLRQFSRQQGVTPFIVLLAAWSVVLTRLAGQDEVVIGSPVANRGRSELEGVVGFFANTLALRINVAAMADVQQLLQHTRDQVIQAQAHQDLPFEQVVERLNPSRQRGHTPLFQVMLSWQEREVLPQFAGLEVESRAIDYQRVKFDLELVLGEASDGRIYAQLAYATALFSAERMQQQFDYLQRVLSAMVAQPQLRLSSITLLSDQQRAALLAFGRASQMSSTVATLPALFDAQLTQCADAIAVRHADRTLTYRELNQRADCLAQQLITHGVQPEQRVALCAERSIELIVAILAILKAGAAYLPLDPAYPGARLRYILQDAEPSLLLADEVGYAVLRQPDVPTLMLHPGLFSDRHENAANPELPTPTAANLAYLIYTSGSTGQPKGVMVEHQQIVNLMLATVDVLLSRIVDRVRVVMNSSIMFDASWGELQVLFYGGELILTAAEDKREPAKVVAHLVTEQANYFCCTPSQLEGLLNAGLAEQLTRQLMLVIGGEAISVDLWQRLQQTENICAANVYGPTETTVDATFVVIERDGLCEPVIGRPLANNSIYLLDQQQQLVPPGAIGEIYIGGTGVARGYFKRADLTAERFLPDPFSAEPGARMYRSGDLGRWRADGQLEYLGRNDEQVKIRGFRIELGEIASQLKLHRSVSDAVVITHGAANALQLVAYLIANAGHTVDAAALREHLAARLPDYMLPVAYVPISTLPLTPNGKLDKRALPKPNAQAFAHAEYIAAEGQIEQQLAAIWRELLAVERISRHDNFFALGGHSLLVVRLCSRVQQAFGVVLEVAQVFSHSSLLELASVIATLPQQTLPQIAPLSRQQPLPLSFAQQRLWFLWQMEGPSATYNIPTLFHLRGTLNRTALLASLNTLYARYASWRSTFVLNQQGDAELVLLPAEAGLPVTELDLSGLPDAERRLTELTEQYAQQPFDLSQGPLVRAQLLKLADQQWCLLLTQHHIISDGWSLGVICQELAQLYNGDCHGDSVALPDRTIDYPDYAAWQRQWLSGDRLKQQSDYWYQQLYGAPERLTLPTDRPRPLEQSYHGSVVSLTFDASLSEQIRQVSRQQGITPFMLLLAAWSVVLTRLAGQDEVVIGSPVANRGQRELENVVGFFANTLALRIKPEPQQDILNLLQQVRERVIQAQAQQDLPFEHVVERLNPTRQRSYTPIFQVMFTWQQPEPLPQLHQLTVETGEVAYQQVKFDLELAISEAADGNIYAQLAYASALFSAESMQQHLDYLQRVLSAMVNQPQQRLSSITLLSDQQRAALLALGRSSQNSGTTATLPALFEAQLAEYGDTIAVCCRDQTISYRQLNQRANQLAHRLIALGVQPEQRVALCAERSIELIVAMLAILKAGGAYVALDPIYPAERLHYILQDAEPLLLLTDERSLAVLGQHNLPTLLLEPSLFEGEDQPDPVIPTLSASNLVYLLYTSGSTGRPKGVMLEHRNVTRVFSTNQHDFDFVAGERWLLFHSYNFDISVWEIWGTLCHGGTLCITPSEMLMQLDQFDRFIEQQQINVLTVTPSALRVMLQQTPRLTTLPCLRCIVLVGEATEAETLRLCLSAKSGVHVINAYGPTETAIYATSCRINQVLADGIAIGRPINDTCIYLLDSEQQLVAPGAVGEIYIGGIGVARGYFKRADLTAERFLPDPFSAEPGARIYRSGDLGYWQADGQLVYLGRNDEQVKIRGFRIELGEIASQLKSHQSVSDAVVITRGEANTLQLVAYLMVNQGESLNSAELRDYLAQRLPEYMLPAVYVPITELPLTPNGKLDKRALPAPDQQAFAHAEYVAPEGQIEQQLAAIWCQLLAVEQVSRHDNFFALGGHSLLAVRLCSRVQQHFGVALAVAQLFSHSRLLDLASVIAALPQEALPEITRLSREQRLPLSFAQQRLWFLWQMEGPSATYNIPALFHLHGELNRAALIASLNTLYARYEAWRSTFVLNAAGEAEVLLLSPESGVPLLEHDLSASADARQALARLSEQQAHQPFDLSREPLVRAGLVKLAEQQWALLLTQHHIISDGWSLAVICQELTQLYNGYCQGDSVALPTRTIDYPDYAAWQRQWLSGERLTQQSDYWYQQLHGAPELLTLPTDYPRPVEPSYHGNEVSCTFDLRVSEQLRQFSRQQGVTPFMLLLAAWSVVLTRLAGQHQVVIGSPVANRGHSALENVVGFFANTLALRIQPEPQQDTLKLLQQVRERVAQAQAHQDLPFEQVVERLNPTRQRSYAPIFQVMLSWQEPELLPQLHQLTVETGEVAYQQVKFDLELALGEAADGRIYAQLAYASALFSAESMQQHLDYLQRVLRAMINQPQQPLSAITLLSNQQRAALLALGRGSRISHQVATLPALFEAQLSHCADAIAVRYGEQALTYRALNQRANRLADQLIKLGVQPEQRVALCAERSLELIVAIMAILKAGGAYLPLDPVHPTERLRYILQDAEPIVLLADQAGRAALGEPAIPTLMLDATQFEHGIDHNADVCPLTPSNLAYLIYTSGSTGQPKGVMVEHQQIVNLVLATGQLLVTQGVSVARMVMNASLMFDASWDELAVLFHGGTLILTASEQRYQP
ncbi:non-ribosomal peptide synthetase, partial [Serratia microhaemolytica]|uniref:non-ribosomal peptide synthetase n=1 Tax=Serratia microhaemolytica TaxID=2675110 RepID=UPI000FDD1874